MKVNLVPRFQDLGRRFYEGSMFYSLLGPQLILVLAIMEIQKGVTYLNCKRFGIDNVFEDLIYLSFLLYYFLFQNVITLSFLLPPVLVLYL